MNEDLKPPQGSPARVTTITQRFLDEMKANQVKSLTPDPTGTEAKSPPAAPSEPEHPKSSPPPAVSRRHKSWGDKAYLLVWPILFGCAGWYLISTHMATVRQRQAAETKQQLTDASLAALAVKYNAVTNWAASLPSRGLGAEPFSIDISKALIGSGQQPVLVECYLNDIVENNGKIIANLSRMEAGVDLAFEFQCSSEQVKTFTGAKKFSSFAIVARCHEVQRLSGEESKFSVKGELLDAVQLP